MADVRDYADVSFGRYVEDVDEETMKITVALFVEDDALDGIDESAYRLDERGKLFFEVPAEYDVCSACDGRGSYVNPNIDRNGITAREMERMGPQFQSDYMGGAYDVTCERCNGKRVEAIPKTRLSEAKEKLVKLVQEQVEEDARFRRVQRAEQGMMY